MVSTKHIHYNFIDFHFGKAVGPVATEPTFPILSSASIVLHTLPFTECALNNRSNAVT
jgi:hypothetical protein